MPGDTHTGCEALVTGSVVEPKGHETANGVLESIFDAYAVSEGRGERVKVCVCAVYVEERVSRVCISQLYFDILIFCW